MMTGETIESQKTPRRSKRVWLFVFGGAFVVAMGIGLEYLISLHAVAEAVSPNGHYRIAVLERRFPGVDRNFRVVLTDLRTGEQQPIFRSDDQSPLIEEEYFVWTGDSKKVALIGDHYFATLNSVIPDGRTVFLVYDIERKTLSCNSIHKRDLPRISGKDAMTMFGERLAQ